MFNKKLAQVLYLIINDNPINLITEREKMENVINSTVQKQSVIKRIFGCWHLKLSRPTTTNNTTYRYCVKCGMRRNYDLETFELKGGFYNPPISKEIYFV